MREHLIQQKVRAILNAPGAVTRVWRNNVGATKTESGGWIEYGLAPGSADLIGIKKVLITPEMVGETFGRFFSVEMKTPTGRLSTAQKIWAATISKFGGIATCWRSEQDAADFLAAKG